ncbi:MAG TPA: hypothetical protein VJ964_09755 [Balneolaceae bacterium]|nr:hypothetical protein [Balneolaceae bacterium]
MSKQKFGLTEGLLIAGVPAVGYWLAFLYQLGYCTYFNIPTSLIEISLLNVLIAIIGLVGFLAIINLYGEPFFWLYKGLPEVIRPAIVKIGAPLIFMCGYAYVTRLSGKPFYVAISIVVIPLLFVEFILPLFTQRKTKGYLAKLKAQKKIDYEYDTMMDTLAKNAGKERFLLFILLFAISFITFFAGGYKAKTKTEFIVLTQPVKSIVLKSYDNNFVTAKFDRDSNTVTAKYTLVPIDKSNFEMDEIGPLKPAKL